MDLNKIRQLIVIILGDRNPAKRDFPVEYFESGLYAASLIHFKKKIGLPEEYQVGMPLPRQAYEITRKIKMDLLPFHVEMGTTSPSLVVNDHGLAELPANVYYPSVFRYRYMVGIAVKHRPIDIVNDLEWNERMRNSITKGTKKHPVCNFIGPKRVRFSPVDLRRVDFDYVKFPNRPVFAYNIDLDYIDYDETRSTQLEWDDVNIMDVISIFMEKLGVSIGSPDIVQYADKLKNTGQ